MIKRTEINVESERLGRDTHSRGRECREYLPALKRTRGRPKKYPKLMRVRLTKGEHEEVSKGAKEAGISLSRYVIEGAIANHRKAPIHRPVDPASQLQREWAIFEVARVGNNLNQIARQLNSQRGSLSSKKIEQVLVELSEKLTGLRELWGQQEDDEAAVL